MNRCQYVDGPRCEFNVYRARCQCQNKTGKFSHLWEILFSEDIVEDWFCVATTVDGCSRKALGGGLPV
jgi:hypothetical protein